MSAKKRIFVGVFIIGGICLFGLGLFLIGSREQLFASHFHVYANFNSIDTLQSGATVRVSGMNAGQITAIQVPKNPSERFRLTLQIDDKFRPIVRDDSVATIETSGMVGNKYINVAKGSANSPECPNGGTLPSQEPVDIGALMRQGGALVKTVQATIKDIRTRADTAIDNISNVAGNANGMVVSIRGDVKRIASNGVQISSDARQIVAGVRNGHGAAGKLLTDQTVASNLAATISNAKQTSVNVESTTRKADVMVSDIQKNDLRAIQQTVDNTQSMTSQLNQAVGTFLSKGNSNEPTAMALRETVHGAQQTTANLADDTEAIKHNFFFRGFFHRRGFFNLSDITPGKYESSEFVKDPRARVWVPSAGLFTVSPEGEQELTSTGKAILDQYMSDLVPYLPNNPMVVEGYSTEGTPDQRYLAARQRAIQVREYLESRFHLKPALVGLIAFGDQPPHGTKKKIWNGVSLVLVAEKKQ